MSSKIFGALACVGQLAALFPFAVTSVAVIGAAPAVWRFAVIFAVWTAFRESGRGMSALAEKIKRGRTTPPKLHPLINFLTRFGCVIPVAAFIAACVFFKFPPALYFYALPPSAAIYFGGYYSVGRSYSGVFSVGWFAVYPISALLASIMLNSELSEAASWAVRALCAGFAAEILLFVVIANQANIDKCTKQRDAGKAALPRGLRRYNAVLVAGIFAASLGLFIFARPLGRMFMTALAAVVAAVLFVIDRFAGLFGSPDEFEAQTSEGADRLTNFTDRYGGGVNDIVMTLFVIVAVVLLIVFRKQLWNAFKRAFAAVFRNRAKGFDTPYADEIMSSDAKRLSPRSEKKAERELARQYAREASPKRRFRLGYALFLARLRRTEHPPAPSDTTDIHREKGERVWDTDLSGFSETYDRVRYGDVTPSPEELEAQAEILRQLEVRSKR